MATNFNATLQAAAVTGPKVKSNVENGKLRVFTSSYTVPSSPPIVADTITWGTIPSGCQILGWLSQMNCADGASSSTLNLGTSTTPTAYLGASSVADPAVFALTAINADGAVSLTTVDTTLVSVVAGATLLAGQVITVSILYIQD